MTKITSMSILAEQTLASIVRSNHQAVPVLEKYNLDFCCKGKRTLAEACIEKGLPLESVTEELSKRIQLAPEDKTDFASMNAAQLISYILLQHHFYVKQAIPNILAHLQRVAQKHGERFPFMVEVFYLFNEVATEMSAHMQKEEMILFPRIKEIETLISIHQHRNLDARYVTAPIQVMEAEHDAAGELMYRIRELTGNYTAPEEACTTFRISLAELKEFEEDLHRHVHIENNILFPLAEKLFEQQAA